MTQSLEPLNDAELGKLYEFCYTDPQIWSLVRRLARSGPRESHALPRPAGAVLCPSCRGTGTREAQEDVVYCIDCFGTGTVLEKANA